MVWRASSYDLVPHGLGGFRTPSHPGIEGTKQLVGLDRRTLLQYEQTIPLHYSALC